MTVEKTFNPQEILWENLGDSGNNFVKDLTIFLVMTLFTSVALVCIALLEIYIRVLDAQ